MEKSEDQARKEPLSVETWYKTDVIHERDILGVPVKIKEISGPEYTKLVDECTDGRGKLNRDSYCEKIIKKCVVEPPIDIRKLKPAPLALIVGEVEKILGLTEVALKNLSER